LTGEVDAALVANRTEIADWYEKNVESGALLDLGTVYNDQSDYRILASPALQAKAPEVADFLSRVKIPDAVVAEAAGRITTGRIGVSPAVSSQIFFKQQEAVWTPWVDQQTATFVRDAIARGENSLNRKCIKVPGAIGMVCSDT